MSLREWDLNLSLITESIKYLCVGAHEDQRVGPLGSDQIIYFQFIIFYSDTVFEEMICIGLVLVGIKYLTYFNYKSSTLISDRRPCPYDFWLYLECR
jgi:hypothetical protein